jgi:hypothetical protein
MKRGHVAQQSGATSTTFNVHWLGEGALTLFPIACQN